MKRGFTVLLAILFLLSLLALPGRANGTQGLTQEPVLLVSVGQIPLSLNDDPATSFNGSIVIAHTDPSLGTTDIILYYNGSFENVTRLPFEITGEGLVYSGKELYIVGGEFGNNTINSHVIQVNMTTQKFTVMSGRMPTPVYAGAVFCDQGLIYVLGGVTSTQAGPGSNSFTNSIQVYDLSTEQWYTSTSTLPTPEAYMSYTFNGSQLIMVGGEFMSQPLPYVYLFNPATGAVSTLVQFPYNVEGSAVAYYNGVVYVIGGLLYQSTIQVTGSVYALENNTWREVVKSMPPVAFAPFGQVGNNVLVFGGYTEGNVQSFSLINISIVYPPPEPRLSSQSEGNGWVYVSWDSNASFYRVILTGNNGTLAENVSTNYVNFTGLLNGAFYNLTVIPFNQAGPGKPLQIYDLEPSTVPLSPSAKLKPVVRGYTLYLNDSQDGGKPIDQYIVVVYSGDRQVGSWATPYNKSVLKINDLIPGENYTILIYAHNQNGNSSPAKYQVTAYGIPLFLPHLSFNNGTVYLSLNTNQSSRYEVTEYFQGVPHIVYQGSNSSIVLHLQGYGVYNFSVTAYNPVGNFTSYVGSVSFFPPPIQPKVNATVQNNTIYINWSKDQYALKYEVQINNTIYNTSSTSFEFPIAAPGLYLIKIYVIDPSGVSLPGVTEVMASVPTSLSTSTILTQPPHTTEHSTTPSSFVNPIFVYVTLILIIVGAATVLLKR